MTKVITSTDYSPVVNIVTWVLQAATLLLVFMKLVLAHTSFGLQKDDWSVLVATVFAIGQACAVSVQSFSGLGEPQNSLSSTKYDRFEKSAYAAQFLFIASIIASKMSIVFFVYYLTRKKVDRRTALAIGGFLVLWGVSSIFVTAFQCSEPHPWSMLSGRCISNIPFWTSFAAINVATEIFLIGTPIQIIYRTSLVQYKKSALIFCFTLRLCVIGAIAAQLYCMYSPLHFEPMKTRSDFTLNAWPYMLTTEIVQALSIITVCVPFVKPLLVGLESGMFQTGRVHLGSIARPNGTSTGTGTGMGTMDAEKDIKIGSDDERLSSMRTDRSGPSRNDEMSETICPSYESHLKPSDASLNTTGVLGSSRHTASPDHQGQADDTPREIKRSSKSSSQLMRDWGFSNWFSRRE